MSDPFGFDDMARHFSVPEDDPAYRFPPAEAYERDADAPLRSNVVRLNPNQGEAPPRTSRFFKASELQGRPIPEREWLVDGLIPDRTVSLLSGDGGTGKSLLALQLATAAATGGWWIGRRVKPGRAIYLSAEDDEDELHRRLADIVRAERGSLSDLEHLTIRSLAGEDALLAVETHVALAASSLLAELEAAAAAEQDVRVIVLDTLADLYPANENDRAKVRQFIGLLRGLALRCRCSVVLLGHPSLSGLMSGSGSSGSTAWNNSVRSRLYLERIADGDGPDRHEPDPDRRRLTTKKANYGRVGEEIMLTWRQGVFEPDAPEAGTGMDHKAASAKAERVFLRLLGLLEDQGRTVSPNPGPTYAPTVFGRHPDNEGVTDRAFRPAMEAMLSRGDIAIAEDGPPSKRRKTIVRARGLK